MALTRITTIYSERGFPTEIFHADEMTFSSLAQDGDVDAFIVAAEHGFRELAQLHPDLRFLAGDLGIPEREIETEREIVRWATWNSYENQRVTLVALAPAPGRQGGSLRGVILAACETSECYRRYAWPYHGRPYRDFFYNVTCESIAHASRRWGARHLAISDLGGQRFADEIVKCQVEALVHFCDPASAPVLNRFIFAGHAVTLQHFEGIERIIEEAHKTKHRPIAVETETRNHVKLIHLSWRLQGPKGIAVNEEFNRTEYGFCEHIERWFAHEMGYVPCRWEVDAVDCVAKLILKRQPNGRDPASPDFRSKCEDILLRAALPLGENENKNDVLLNVAGDEVEVSFRFPKDMAHVFSAPRNTEAGDNLDVAVAMKSRLGFCQYIEQRFSRIGHAPRRWEVDLSASVARLILKRQPDAPSISHEDFRSKSKDILVRAALPLEENHPIVHVNGGDVEISFRYPSDMSPRFSAPRKGSTVPVNIKAPVPVSLTSCARDP